jgi:hypothetical protein
LPAHRLVVIGEQIIFPHLNQQIKKYMFIILLLIITAQNTCQVIFFNPIQVVSVFVILGPAMTCWQIILYGEQTCLSVSAVAGSGSFLL